MSPEMNGDLAHAGGPIEPESTPQPGGPVGLHETAEGATADRAARLRRLLTSVNGVPVTTGNRIDVLRNGEEIFPAMLDAIDDAERAIDLLTYVYWDGEIGKEFAHRLARRAREGVRVRVLLDGVGAKPIANSTVTEMRNGGADVRFFRPPRPHHPFQATHRTHRKVMVADERVAFTGGVGIADEWMGDGRTSGAWRDTHVRLRGPAVQGLRSAFLDNWVETEPVLYDPTFDHFPDLEAEGDSVVQIIKGTAEPGWNDISMTVRCLIEAAERTMRLTTAYFVPDDDLVVRMVRAAERGVDVHVLLPGPEADKRFVQVAGEAVYHRLLDADVHISCYQPSMLHAKILTIDGIASLIGSANFNQRSTSLDEEVDIIAFDPTLTSELDGHFDEDLGLSEELDPSRWERRNPGQRLLERGATLLRPWM